MQRTDESSPLSFFFKREKGKARPFIQAAATRLDQAPIIAVLQVS
jgi:hypothetical protein